MLKFIYKLVICTVLIVVFFVGINSVTTKVMCKYNGQSTEQKVILGFENAIKGNYNCFILGNSKVYRGINPEMITGLQAFNFAHDNDAYNQMYYKLLYLEKHNVDIDVLIIDTDYNHFSYTSDTRNYVYDRYLGMGYIKDYNNLYNELVADLTTYTMIQRDNLKHSINHILKRTKAPAQVNYMKDNGQYIAYGTATENDTIKRNGSITDSQLGYFDRIVQNCIDNDIDLYVVVAPGRDVELDSYGFTEEQFKEFDDMVMDHLTDKYRENYYNCSNLDEFKDISNYVDVAHLNEDAANRFTAYLNQTMLSKY